MFEFSQEQQSFLNSAPLGRLAMSDESMPYIVPIHFVTIDGRIYLHGRTTGKKMEILKKNPNVCFELDEMGEHTLSEDPCHVGTLYRSMLIDAVAEVITDFEIKKMALQAFVQKYAPALSGNAMSEARIVNTAIIALTPEHCSLKRR